MPTIPTPPEECQHPATRRVPNKGDPSGRQAIVCAICGRHMGTAPPNDDPRRQPPPRPQQRPI